MELPIQLDILRHVKEVRQILLLLQVLLHLKDALITAAMDGGPEGPHLQHSPCLIHLPQIRGGGLCHHGAPIGLLLDETVIGQPHQRRAHRSPADTGFPHQILFHDAGAGIDGLGDDLIFDVIVDDIRRIPLFHSLLSPIPYFWPVAYIKKLSFDQKERSGPL